MELLRVKDFLKFCKPVKGCYYNLSDESKKLLQRKYAYLKEHKDRKINYIESIHKFSMNKDYVSLCKNCDLLTSIILWKNETIAALESL